VSDGRVPFGCDNSFAEQQAGGEAMTYDWKQDIHGLRCYDDPDEHPEAAILGERCDRLAAYITDLEAVAEAARTHANAACDWFMRTGACDPLKQCECDCEVQGVVDALAALEVHHHE
jgi:hypothetical protein